jgi:hypothetical protein
MCDEHDGRTMTRDDGKPPREKLGPGTNPIKDLLEPL